MTIYIALLRGINVGGNKKIKMAELKSALEDMGLSRVQTYIQSGNVLFESEEGAGPLRQRIEQEIRTVFGMSVTVILRTSEELEQIIGNCPYATDNLQEGESVHVSLLLSEPTQKEIDILSAGITDIDEFQIRGKEIYCYYRQRILDSKLANNLQKLGNSVTSRNWNTMKKLDSLAKAFEE